MNEPTITCPQCRNEIKLTESLAAPMIEVARRDLQAKIAAKDSEIAAREEALRVAQGAIDKRRESLEHEISEQLTKERKSITEDARKAAARDLAADLAQRDEALKRADDRNREQAEKLKLAQDAQLEAQIKSQELDDARRELELTVQTRVRESLGTERERAKQDAEAAMGLKLAERDETIASMQRQVEELRRRAEQGSQQLQGEVQELELENLLRTKFPHDVIEAVPKGEHGGDLLHRVFTPGGQLCGTILWEAKRTKNWSDAWLSKLRDDQRSAHAEVALIVSHALPKGMQSFDLMDGVWIAEPKCAVPVAIAIRQTLIQVAGTRLSAEGQQTKTALVYAYLTGPGFRHRIEAIVERFSEMQDDLDRERKAMTRLWAKREQQIKGVLEATAGMYGDLQGIAGRSLAEIEGLTLLAPAGDGLRLLEGEA